MARHSVLLILDQSVPIPINPQNITPSAFFDHENTRIINGNDWLKSIAECIAVRRELFDSQIVINLISDGTCIISLTVHVIMSHVCSYRFEK